MFCVVSGRAVTSYMKGLIQGTGGVAVQARTLKTLSGTVEGSASMY